MQQLTCTRKMVCSQCITSLTSACKATISICTVLCTPSIVGRTLVDVCYTKYEDQLPVHLSHISYQCRSADQMTVHILLHKYRHSFHWCWSNSEHILYYCQNTDQYLRRKQREHFKPAKPPTPHPPIYLVIAGQL